MTEPLELAMRIERAFADRDLEALAALWSDDIDYEAPGLALRGKAARMVAETVWLEAFPDVVVEIRHRAVDGPCVVFESVMRGTHTGPLRLGDDVLPPTGATIEGAYVSIFRFEDGKVARQRVYYDRLELLTSLGGAPGAPARETV